MKYNLLDDSLCFLICCKQKIPRNTGENTFKLHLYKTCVFTGNFLRRFHYFLVLKPWWTFSKSSQGLIPASSHKFPSSNPRDIITLQSFFCISVQGSMVDWDYFLKLNTALQRQWAILGAKVAIQCTYLDVNYIKMQKVNAVNNFISCFSMCK